MSAFWKVLCDVARRLTDLDEFAKLLQNVLDDNHVAKIAMVGHFYEKALFEILDEYDDGESDNIVSIFNRWFKQCESMAIPPDMDVSKVIVLLSFALLLFVLCFAGHRHVLRKHVVRAAQFYSSSSNHGRLGG